MPEEKIFDNLQKDIKKFYEKINNHKNDDEWTNVVKNLKTNFIDDNFNIKKNYFRNFRRNGGVHEVPTSQYKKNFLSLLRPGCRAEIKFCEERIEVLKKNGDLDSLIKNPLNNIGKPYYFSYNNLKYNERWTRHIRYLNLISLLLNKKKDENLSLIDIGGAYGLFSGLIKKNYPLNTYAVLDFPEQLFLAYYYLSMNFPNSKINLISDVINIDKIDKNFISNYDFTLIPVNCLNKIESNTFDILTNFNSFGEMSKENFLDYINSDLFRTIKYFFTVNRLDSFPTYKNDLSIINYPLSEFKPLHFTISPLYKYIHFRNFFWKTKKIPYSSRCFEFIGERLYK